MYWPETWIRRYPWLVATSGNPPLLSTGSPVSPTAIGTVPPPSRVHGPAAEVPVNTLTATVGPRATSVGMSVVHHQSKSTRLRSPLWGPVQAATNGSPGVVSSPSTSASWVSVVSSGGGD